MNARAPRVRFLQLLQRPAARNAIASYAAYASTAIWGIVSIPVAVHFLSKEQIGLWALVNAAVSYLFWMDLGVGASTGRLMTEAVVSRDRQEIDRWWSLTKVILSIQGLLIVLVGLALAWIAPKFIAVPQALHRDTIHLVIGTTFIAGLFLPMRGASGLLTAQGRFHWNPVIQATSPWVNLLFFILLLRAGWGLESYLAALFASQTYSWLLYHGSIRLGPDRPRWDKAGITKQRFAQLFSFSGKITVVGLSNTLLASLPTLLIAKLGGLASVPVYNFSWKGPLIVSGIVQRTYQAFYPHWVRMYVSGEAAALSGRHRNVAMLTLSVGLLGASGILLANPLLVDLIAGGSFFAGGWANTWFALAAITIPMAGIYRILPSVTGDLGKIAWVSAFTAILGGLLSIPAWRFFGIAGVASVFSLVPVVPGAYCLSIGARACGTSMAGFAGAVPWLTLLALLLVLACASLARATHDPSFPPLSGQFGSENVLSILFSLIPVLPAIFLLVHAVRHWQRQVQI